MPIYTYTCRECSKEFELLIGMSAHKVTVQCPGCSSKNVVKTFAPFSMKGSKSKCSSCSSGSCSTCH